MTSAAKHLGVRDRPMKRWPQFKTCIEPVDMASHRAEDESFHLADTSSYPSTHAAIGMIWALVLSQVLGDSA